MYIYNFNSTDIYTYICWDLMISIIGITVNNSSHKKTKCMSPMQDFLTHIFLVRDLIGPCTSDRGTWAGLVNMKY